jgi:hypothetical protein
MQTNTKISHKLTLGDIWEEIVLPRNTHHKSKEKDNVTCRVGVQKSGTLKISFGIGHDICDILQWKRGDKITWFRNKLNGTLIKLVKTEMGYTLCEPNKKSNRMVITPSVESNRRYVLDKTEIVNFDIEKNGLIVDISKLCLD